ncbi:CIA30 family protein [Ferrimonas balearica]|uniref:CIA30 family protein n=1 Tax=Ferrimonas balearica TaxID=44012 RepID=UPI001C99B2D8|nr:CIA30 family protein [Ferrimonas balearica]MBY5993311.1 CIA30 family protein [Ferrimonas balearica]
MWQLQLDEVAPWRAVNDDVMGGQSQSQYEARDGQGRFWGRVSLANGGGFASVRRPVSLPPTLSQLVLKVRGDGRRYQLRLRTHRRLDGVVYAAPFDTQKGQWQTLTFVASDFTATYRGRPVAGAPPLVLAEARQLGLLIGQGQAGDFALSLASLVGR